MALRDLVDWVERSLVTFAAKGSMVQAIYVCPAGEQGILKENIKTPNGYVDIIPELRIHGVPIKVAKRMRAGRFFYLLKEQK